MENSVSSAMDIASPLYPRDSSHTRAPNNVPPSPDRPGPRILSSESYACPSPATTGPAASPQPFRARTRAPHRIVKPEKVILMACYNKQQQHDVEETPLLNRVLQRNFVVTLKRITLEARAAAEQQRRRAQQRVMQLRASPLLARTGRDTSVSTPAAACGGADPSSAGASRLYPSPPLSDTGRESPPSFATATPIAGDRKRRLSDPEDGEEGADTDEECAQPTKLSRNDSLSPEIGPPAISLPS
eukprot:m.179909 g.179909  ORF g.179909 m.179909 type:complete len:244 (-) comp14881_c0_seq1:167-898(-)